MTFDITLQKSAPISPAVFGFNLEHTRSAVNTGLSAQMLRNRKFAGKPAKNSGVAAEWKGVGDRAFFQNGGRDCYTRHIGCEKMRRGNELQSQSVQNVRGGVCGIMQDGLCLKSGVRYEIRAVAKCYVPVTLAAELTDRKGQAVYARAEVSLVPGDWQTAEFTLAPAADDCEGAVRFVFEERAEVIFGAVSMMAEGHFHGMRADVVKLFRELGPAVIRWPGGNFAGEYRWKDGLLPSDMRGPLQAVTEIETQPHSHGYDFHEISTDDFIALCREVGAEPFLTINLVWNSPEDSADWAEYCNGSPDTPYGKKRAENGHPEPYGVRFFSLGNEMGYGHMEGPMKPEDYASLAAEHIRAMKAVSPEIEFFSSGPYPNDAWAEGSAARLADNVPFISLHHYSGAAMDYTTPEKTAATYRAIAAAPQYAERTIRAMRDSLDRTGKKLAISFDEWNFWYAWYRPSCVGEGIFTAKMLHMLLKNSGPLGMPFCCYFQPIGEGAVLVEPDSARLTANGQVFSLMKAHKGGILCGLGFPEGEADDGSALVTVKDGSLTATFINDAYDEPKEFLFTLPEPFASAPSPAETLLLSSEDVAPYSYFDASPLEIEQNGGKIRVVLPPHSAGKLVWTPAE